MHKATLCAKLDISTTYYNKLLTDGGNPSFELIIKALKLFDLQLFVGFRE